MNLLQNFHRWWNVAAVLMGLIVGTGGWADALKLKALGIELWRLDRGVEVKWLEIGSPAEVSGLRHRDQIVRVEGYPIPHEREFDRVVEQYASGSRLKLEILRGAPPVALTLFLMLPYIATEGDGVPSLTLLPHHPHLLATTLTHLQVTHVSFNNLSRVVARQGVPIGLEEVIGLSLSPGQPSFPLRPHGPPYFLGDMNYQAPSVTVEDFLKAVLPAEHYTYEESYGVVNLFPTACLTLGDVDPLNIRLPALSLPAGPLENALPLLKRCLPRHVSFGIGPDNARMSIDQNTALTLTMTDNGNPIHPPWIIRPIKFPAPLFLPAGLTLRQAINALVTACGLGEWHGTVHYQYGLGPAKKDVVSINVYVCARPGEPGGP